MTDRSARRRTPAYDATNTIVFRLTSNNLREGGRRRVGEAYLNVSRMSAAFFGARDIDVVTDTGLEFPAKLSGSSGAGSASTPKNLRSKPSRMLGYWLLQQCQAQPGDEVHVSAVGANRFEFRFVRRSKATLEEELVSLLPATTSDRNREIVKRRYGWDGDGGQSLQDVADEHGITRERVRQICERTARWHTAPQAPVLDRALEFVARRAPASANFLEAELVDQGITSSRFALEGLSDTAKALGRALPFVLSTVGGQRFAVPITSVEAPDVVRQRARLTVSRWGAVTIEEVVARSAEVLTCAISQDFVREVLTNDPNFQWLDEGSGWFWVSDVPRNRLLNQIRKVLSVAERIDVTDLRRAVGRSHRMKGVTPPRRVLLELCKRLPGYRVEGSTVIADPPLDWGEVLGDTDEAFALALKEEGPVMQRMRLEELCLGLGMNRHTFWVYLEYSPIVTRLARGVYSLVGAEVPPGVVESLTPRVNRAGRVLLDHGWTSDGKVWLSYRVNEGMIGSGVVSVPAGMRKFVSGEFRLVGEDGDQEGTFVARNASAWGLGPLIRRRGAEAGDYLLVLLDLKAGLATCQIGEETLLDSVATTQDADVQQV
jgi:hypothetical protein